MEPPEEIPDPDLSAAITPESLTQVDSSLPSPQAKSLEEKWTYEPTRPIGRHEDRDQETLKKVQMIMFIVGI